MLRIVVLISGNGSNLQALIDTCGQAGFRARIVGVISNKPEAFGLQRAAAANITTAVIDHLDYPDRDSYDQALAAQIDAFEPDLVVLAGFMRILTDAFVRHYSGRLLNIHPSLLPAYKGLNTHRRVLEAGDKIHGASVHFVNKELDGGPVVLQAKVTVQTGDTPETLAARVLEKEHIMYPLVISWIAEGRLVTGDKGPVYDGQLLTEPLQLDEL